MKELIKMKAEAAATGLPLRSTGHAQLLKLFVRGKEEDDSEDEDGDDHQYENPDNVQRPWENDEQCVCVHTSFLEIPLVGTWVTLYDMHFLNESKMIKMVEMIKIIKMVEMVRI